MPKLTAKITKVIYTSKAYWRILSTDKGKALGVIRFDVQPGDELILDGDWARSDYSGTMEFKFKSAASNIPTDPRALLTYAASITKGLGERKEAEIWAAFGADWQQHPYLERIKGISETTRFHWQDTLRRIVEQSQMAASIAFFLSKHLTLNMANAAWEKWKDQSTGIVMADPYILATLPHYGFHAADALRQYFGISDLDPRRADACALYSVAESAALGDTAPSLMDVREIFTLHLSPDDFDASLERLMQAGKIISLSDSQGVQRVALHVMFEDETKIYDRFFQ